VAGADGFEGEGVGGGFGVGVGAGEAGVLAFVFDPGIDEEGFDVEAGDFGVVEDGPLDGAIAAANALEFIDGLQEVVGAGRIDSVFDENHNRAFFGVG